MLPQIPILFFNSLILKRASQLPLRERLYYLRLCRVSFLFCIPVFAILALISSFSALAVFFPQLLLMLGIPLPSDQGESPFLMSGIFILLTFFCGLAASVLFITRELIAKYWLLNFILFFDLHRARPTNQNRQPALALSMRKKVMNSGRWRFIGTVVVLYVVNFAMCVPFYLKEPDDKKRVLLGLGAIGLCIALVAMGVIIRLWCRFSVIEEDDKK